MLFSLSFLKKQVVLTISVLSVLLECYIFLTLCISHASLIRIHKDLSIMPLSKSTLQDEGNTVHATMSGNLDSAMMDLSVQEAPPAVTLQGKLGKEDLRKGRGNPRWNF